MIDRNLALEVGALGLLATVIFFAWLIVRIVARRNTSPYWWLGLVLLFATSLITCVGSQVTIISRLSSGGGTDGD